MTNNNITEEMIEAARAVADGVDDTAFERIYTAMQAASQPPVTMDGLVERLLARDDDDTIEAANRITTLLATIEAEREAAEKALGRLREALGLKP